MSVRSWVFLWLSSLTLILLNVLYEMTSVALLLSLRSVARAGVIVMLLYLSPEVSRSVQNA